jgi:hypothetical protein
MDPMVNRVAYTIPCIGAPVHSPEGVVGGSRWSEAT